MGPKEAVGVAPTLHTHLPLQLVQHISVIITSNSPNMTKVFHARPNSRIVVEKWLLSIGHYTRENQTFHLVFTEVQIKQQCPEGFASIFSSKIALSIKGNLSLFTPIQ